MSAGGVRRVMRHAARFGRLLEDSALVALLSAMIGLAVLQILTRNSDAVRGFLLEYLGTNLVWADELLRIMVLWVALVGAIAASREDRHISIDLLSRFLPGRWRLAGQVVVDLFTAVVCAVIAWHAAIFVDQTHAFGDTVLGGQPAWVAQLIIPLAFAIISYRYGLFFLKKLYWLVRGQVPT